MEDAHSRKQLPGQLLPIFMKAGFRSFSGGAGIYSLLVNDILKNETDADEDAVLSVLEKTKRTPGLSGALLSFFSGEILSGKKGAVLSLAGAMLPAFLLIFVPLILCGVLKGEDMLFFRLWQWAVLLLMISNAVRLKDLFPGKYAASLAALTVWVLTAFLGAGNVLSAAAAFAVYAAADLICVGRERSRSDV